MAEETLPDQLDISIKPELYFPTPIFWFSVVITPLFGGILLMMNLRRLDKPKQATQVLLISLLMTALLLTVLTYFDIDNRILQWSYNILCGFILSNLLYKKHIPNAEEYPKRSVIVPLIIAVFIIVSLGLLLFWAQDQLSYQQYP